MLVRRRGLAPRAHALLPGALRHPTPPHSPRTTPVFMKKYMDIAQRFPGVVLMQVYGDESPETRKLMVSMKVKVRSV